MELSPVYAWYVWQNDSSKATMHQDAALALAVMLLGISDAGPGMRGVMRAD
jgi:hypothetical protein